MLSFLHNFSSEKSHANEMRESRDEILIGEIVTIMVEKGYPPIGFWASSDYQRVRFRALNDPILYSVTITLDRKTGGGAISSAILGDKATLTFVCEIKNYLADPDDLIKMYKVDFLNIYKIPVMGRIKIDHQFNSVIATTTEIIEIKELIMKGEAGRQKLETLLFKTIYNMRDMIASFKKNI